MGITDTINSLLSKVKKIYTKVTSTIPNAINNVKSNTRTIKNTVTSLPSKISAIPRNIGSIVSDKIGTLREGFDDAVDVVRDLPTTIMTGVESSLTKSDGFLDRAGLVDDNGELRNFSNLKEGVINTTNTKMLRIGDGMKSIADKVEDGIDSAVRAGTAGLALAAKTAGNFIKDNTKEGLKLAGDFTKNLVKNQLESTGVGPFMKKNWHWFGLGASAAGGAYLYSIVGMPVFSAKSSIAIPHRFRQMDKNMKRVMNRVDQLAVGSSGG